mgnify:CR=1 FL=1
MRAIMGEEKKSELDRVTFTSDSLRKYSPRGYIPAGMQETIIKFLEHGILFYLPADIIPLAGEGAMKAISDITNVLFFKGENRDRRHDGCVLADGLYERPKKIRFRWYRNGDRGGSRRCSDRRAEQFIWRKA